MKMISILSAGLIGAAALVATPLVSAADAQQRVVRERVVVQHHRTVTRNSGYGHYRNKRVCKVTFRNGNRIRRCRTIRYRY